MSGSQHRARNQYFAVKATLRRVEPWPPVKLETHFVVGSTKAILKADAVKARLIQQYDAKNITISIKQHTAQ